MWGDRPRLSSSDCDGGVEGVDLGNTAGANQEGDGGSQDAVTGGGVLGDGDINGEVAKGNLLGAVGANPLVSC